uniref:Uncharacterized protein n=1 Tax=Sphaerodactylus townsendi TaxID=933632 RepID=A0ACB8GBG2_9SAUR
MGRLACHYLVAMSQRDDGAKRHKRHVQERPSSQSELSFASHSAAIQTIGVSDSDAVPGQPAEIFQTQTSGMCPRKSAMHPPPAGDPPPSDGMRWDKRRLAEGCSAQEGLGASHQAAALQDRSQHPLPFGCTGQGGCTGTGLSPNCTPSTAPATLPMGLDAPAEPSHAGPSMPKWKGALRPGLQERALAAGPAGEGSAGMPRAGGGMAGAVEGALAGERPVLVLPPCLACLNRKAISTAI